MRPMRAIRRWNECHLHQLQRVSYPHQPSHRQAKGPSELSLDNGPSRMMAQWSSRLWLAVPRAYSGTSCRCVAVSMCDGVCEDCAEPTPPASEPAGEAGGRVSLVPPGENIETNSLGSVAISLER